MTAGVYVSVWANLLMSILLINMPHHASHCRGKLLGLQAQINGVCSSARLLFYAIQDSIFLPFLPHHIFLLHLICVSLLGSAQAEIKIRRALGTNRR